MKISELCEKLDQLKATEGDLEVLIYDDAAGYGTPYPDVEIFNLYARYDFPDWFVKTAGRETKFLSL